MDTWRAESIRVLHPGETLGPTTWVLSGPFVLLQQANRSTPIRRNLRPALPQAERGTTLP